MTARIDRHRTARRRIALSSPVQHLLRFGFLDGSRSLFDYGCGRGDDLRLLAGMKVRATGWDPVFRPEGERHAADIVNLGFVLNVIEDASERRESLKAAFAAFEDGVRTQRNTFQKYYVQDEFRSYVEKTLGTNAVPIAAGIFLVFKDAMEEQLFLLARQQVRREWRLLRREPDSEAVAAMIRDHREQIDAYWLRALELGRPAAPEECPEAQTLIGLVGSWRRVHEWVGRFFSLDEFEAAAIGRQEDLLMYFALGHFGKRQPYSQFPDRLQRDLQFFFGSITKARNAGKRALFATGDSARLEEAAAFCHEELGIGVLNDDHDLTFHQSVLGECLPLIRIYVGCALQLFGDAGSVDLIKVHLQSGKATFLVYDDFEGATIPKLIERIKVDLPRLRVDFLDYVGEYEPQALDEDRKGFYQR